MPYLIYVYLYILFSFPLYFNSSLKYSSYRLPNFLISYINVCSSYMIGKFSLHLFSFSYLTVRLPPPRPLKPTPLPPSSSLISFYLSLIHMHTFFTISTTVFTVFTPLQINSSCISFFNLSAFFPTNFTWKVTKNPSSSHFYVLQLKFIS